MSDKLKDVFKKHSKSELHTSSGEGFILREVRYMTLDQFRAALNELVPSEEEIKNTSLLPENSGSTYVKNHMPGQYEYKKIGFMQGAKWLRSKILGD